MAAGDRPTGPEPLVLRPCFGCGAWPGDYHETGCDDETCPRCGLQYISCDCIYEINDYDPDSESLKKHHYDIYVNGPTAEMVVLWDAEWGHRRVPWAGFRVGLEECREYGFWYTYWPPPKLMGIGRLSLCSGWEPEAMEDLNRVYTECRWDPFQQRYVREPDGIRANKP